MAEADDARDPIRTVCDYSNSYVTFVTRGRGNLARLLVESRCALLAKDGKLIEEFFQFASCKAEHTYAKENLFQNPNYDFSGIFSRDNYVIFRTRLPYSGTYDERGAVRDRFDDLLFQIRAARGVQTLTNNAEIVKATLDGRPLIGRTEYHPASDADHTRRDRRPARLPLL